MHLVKVHRPVCVGPGGNPKLLCVFFFHAAVPMSVQVSLLEILCIFGAHCKKMFSPELSPPSNHPSLVFIFILTIQISTLANSQ